jgi:[acyl-carrier-protein] S-malonyltransferase
VSNPVRWDLCTDTMRDLGVTGFIEIPPAGTLTGLVRRALPDVEALALKTPDDLEAARDMVARHGQSSGLSQSPTWRLVVAPAKGTVSVTHLEAGTTVGTGQTIATVASLRDTYDVVAPHGGRVVEWLVEDGDPVSPGQPIVRLHPQEVPA